MPTTTAAKKTVAKKVAAPKPAPEAPDNVTASVTVSNTEHEPANRPSSFKALHKDQLIMAARHFGTEDEGNEELIRADLEDNGITWDMYRLAFKLPGWEDIDPTVLDFEAEGPDLPEPVEDWEESEVNELTVSEIVTKPEHPTLNEGKYLIKFVGQNWYFERGRYSFTKDNPYALMDAASAQAALVEEPDKFRQAFPDELKQYYS